MKPDLSWSRIGLTFVACIVGVTMLSCAGANLSNMWRDSTFAEAPMRNLLVVALETDAGTRRLWEDGFSAEMMKHGAQVTPSFRLFPDALPDTEQVVEAVRDKGYDGVLVVHRLADETTVTTVPGYATVAPVTRYDPWANRYRVYYRRVREPGYVETDRYVRHQIDVWTTREGGRLVWTGLGSVVDPSSGDDVRNQVIRRVVPELASQKLLPGVTGS
jgi:hypothetical protein